MKPLETLLEIATNNNDGVTPYVIEYLSYCRQGMPYNLTLEYIQVKYERKENEKNISRG